MRYKLLPRADNVGPRIVDEKGRQIAEIWGTRDEAVLFTAAPELRDACQAARDILDLWPPAEWGYRETEIAKVLDAALAYAKPFTEA